MKIGLNLIFTLKWRICQKLLGGLRFLKGCNEWWWRVQNWGSKLQKLSQSQITTTEQFLIISPAKMEACRAKKVNNGTSWTSQFPKLKFSQITSTQSTNFLWHLLNAISLLLLYRFPTLFTVEKTWLLYKIYHEIFHFWPKVVVLHGK